MIYELHDYFLTRVTVKKDKLIFHLPGGFYAVNDKAKKIKPQKLIFTIDKGKYDIKDFISVRISKTTNGGNKVWKSVSLRKLTYLLKKGALIFFDEYESKATNAKWFVLNTSAEHKAHFNIEVLIHDIKEVECE